MCSSSSSSSSHKEERVRAIVEKEFGLAITQKEEEITEIEKAIGEVKEALRVVRGSVVKSYYDKATIKQTWRQAGVVGVHPATRALMGGKRPSTRRATRTTSGQSPMSTSVQSVNRGNEAMMMEVGHASRSTSSSSTRVSTAESDVNDEGSLLTCSVFNSSSKTSSTSDRGSSKLSLSSEDTVAAEEAPRGSHLRSRLTLCVGNVSQRLNEERETSNKCTHKWRLYLRAEGQKDEQLLIQYVSKVVFKLHSSYAPHDVVVVSRPPFQVTRRGWGEFVAVIRVHFKHSKINKAIEVSHQLKLDRTGAQWVTKGAETTFDTWISEQRRRLDSHHLSPTIKDRNTSPLDEMMRDSGIENFAFLDSILMDQGECDIEKSNENFQADVSKWADSLEKSLKGSNGNCTDYSGDQGKRITDYPIETSGKLSEVIEDSKYSGCETVANNSSRLTTNGLRTDVKKSSTGDSNDAKVCSLPPGSSLLKRPSSSTSVLKAKKKTVL